MTLTHLGLVFVGGAGLPALETALRDGVQPATTTMVKEGVSVLAVPPAALIGNPALAFARRADRFCKMTLTAAMEAWQGCQTDPHRTGIILATALGPHATVFRYVNDVLDYGEAKTSPTIFSQSVHAAAASMIASAAGLRGPVVNLADFAFPFEEALTLADCWLQNGRCDTVLVGAAEELSDVLGHVVKRKWPQPHLPVLGEGAVFFRMTRDDGPTVTIGNELSPTAVCHLADTTALGGEQASASLSALAGSTTCRNFTNFWGSTRLGAAFHLATAYLLQQGLVPAGASPLPPGPIQILSACGSRRRVITIASSKGLPNDTH